MSNRTIYGLLFALCLGAFLLCRAAGPDVQREYACPAQTQSVVASSSGDALPPLEQVLGIVAAAGSSFAAEHAKDFNKHFDIVSPEEIKSAGSAELRKSYAGVALPSKNLSILQRLNI